MACYQAACQLSQQFHLVDVTHHSDAEFITLSATEPITGQLPMDLFRPTPALRITEHLYDPSRIHTLHRISALNVLDMVDDDAEESDAIQVTPPFQPQLFPHDDIIHGIRDRVQRNPLYAAWYGAHGIEILHLSVIGTLLVARKIWGDPNVPAGAVSWAVMLAASNESQRFTAPLAAASASISDQPLEQTEAIAEHMFADATPVARRALRVPSDVLIAELQQRSQTTLSSDDIRSVCQGKPLVTESLRASHFLCRYLTRLERQIRDDALYSILQERCNIQHVKWMQKLMESSTSQSVDGLMRTTLAKHGILPVPSDGDAQQMFSPDELYHLNRWNSLPARCLTCRPGVGQIAQHGYHKPELIEAQVFALDDGSFVVDFLSLLELHPLHI